MTSTRSPDLGTSRPSYPVVGVVIPVKDDAPGLRRTLVSLSGQDYQGEVRVVVVDNGSADSSVLLVCQQHQVRYVSESRPGSYAARNRGVAALESVQVLAFTDADCRPEPGWLRAAVDALAEEGVDAVAGRIWVDVPTDRAPSPAEAWEIVTAFQQEKYVRRHGAGATANLVVRRIAFDATGPFEERLMSGGDVEWGRRATASGLTVVYGGDAVVRHPPRRTMRALFAKLRRVHRGAMQRRLLEGGELAGPWAGLAGFRPPLGAVRRAREHEDLAGWRAEAGYVVAEWAVRLYATWLSVVLPRSVRRSVHVGGPAPAAKRPAS